MSIDVLRERLERWAGLSLERGRRCDVLEAVVRERAYALGSPSVAAYCDAIVSQDDPEVERLLNAVTVTYTWFFRDAPQLEALEVLLASLSPTKPVLDVWVAACATGEEAWSVAMLARSAGRSARILATDLNSEALAHAKVGRYGGWTAREVPARHAHGLMRLPDGGCAVVPELKELVHFERHNLMDAPPQAPGKAGWDVIICRNVLIYFPAEASRRALASLAGATAKEGVVLLGGSEVLAQVPDGFEAATVGGRAALRRATKPVPSAPSLVRRLTPVSTPARPVVRATPRPSRPTPRAEPAPPVRRASEHQWLLDGSSRLREGRLAEAVTALERALELEPLRADAQMLLGISLYRLGEAEGAVRTLRGALVLDSRLWPAAFYLALGYGDLGRPDDARATYAWVLELLALEAQVEPSPALADFEPWRAEVQVLSAMRAKGKRQGAEVERFAAARARR